MCSDFRDNLVSKIYHLLDEIQAQLTVSFIRGCLNTEADKKSRVFRWFKFTLKPPYSITHGKLRLAIWDTSFWTFLAQIWTQGTLRHILGPILVIFEICQFLMIPGLFSKNG